MSERPIRVLVADDEESMRHFVQKGLQRLGFDAVAVADGDAALQAWREQPFDLAVLDVRMPGPDGTTVLSRIRSESPHAVVVLMSAHGTVESAVEAMHLGAADFVAKPFAIDELELRVRRALDVRRTADEHQHLRTLLERPEAAVGLCAHSAAMREVVRQLELAANADSTVLLTGESGTGKGLLAKALHLRSPRHAQPLLAMNCAAVPEALAESELFGHLPGAFTGARTAKNGLLQRAAGGTLFLDEIGDMSAPLQAKIERFLQEREFTPLGGEQPVQVDVRVVAATNRDLEQLVERGDFRRELFYRLDVVHLRVPPLRERRDDIPHLIRAFLGGGDDRAPSHRVTPEALAALSAWHWPGNVRELENLLERMVVLAGARSELGATDLPGELRGSDDAGAALAASDDGYEAARARFDRLYFANLLTRAGGNVSEAARLAGISRGHLHRRLKELGVSGS
ncbi:MAG: sigma-54-dependent transcriptional regulator [Planctomycetota bacterium]|jgi:DNA-binding NtrC family response regulator